MLRPNTMPKASAAPVTGTPSTAAARMAETSDPRYTVQFHPRGLSHGPYATARALPMTQIASGIVMRSATHDSANSGAFGKPRHGASASVVTMVLITMPAGDGRRPPDMIRADPRKCRDQVPPILPVRARGLGQVAERVLCARGWNQQLREAFQSSRW